jgi:hypothetical protein
VYRSVRATGPRTAGLTGVEYSADKVMSDGVME